MKQPPVALTTPDGSKVLRVCAWCYPQETVYADYPLLKQPNTTITHGICAEHKSSLVATKPTQPFTAQIVTR